MYQPPRTRQEAVNEIVQTGFTVPAMLAVAIAFPLPGEIEEMEAFLRKMDEALDGTGTRWRAKAEQYLVVWGRTTPNDRTEQGVVDGQGKSGR